MNAPHPTHRYLSLPAWAKGGQHSTSFDGLDLRDPLRAAIPSQALRDALSPIGTTQSAQPGLTYVRESAAAFFKVATDCTYISPGIAYLFRLVCQSALSPGDRVALCEPVPDWVKRCILAVGAAYIDIGRDWSMKPLHGTLHRLLEDGDLRMVFSQSVCSQSGTLGLEPSDAEDVLWVQDHTFNTSPEVTERGLHLVDVSQREGALGLSLGLAVGARQSIEMLWRMDPSPLVSAQAAAMGRYSLTNPEDFTERSGRWKDARDALRLKLQELPGFQLTGEKGPAAMLRRSDMTSEQLQAALAGHGIHVWSDASHTYHDHVVLGLPESRDQQILIDALGKVSP